MTINRAKELEAAGKAVNQAIKHLIAEGYEDQDLSNALFGYALSLMCIHNSRQDVARHLYVTALKFADQDFDVFGDSAAKH